ncbi:MAG: neutral/alkaline non-lysosomal ceramidase N-terminal domain-containing protein [Bryobacterales bacterium]|jgi:hypothetical protein|nr:neutral/alkaline non-lysosomal ceramidase N-terminal domain-containing protein [Bryobacterales bacterium]
MRAAWREVVVASTWHGQPGAWWRVWVLAILFTLPMAAQDFRVGLAAVDITPPPGAPMAGYYFNRAAEGVHDPLQAKAMVLESGTTRVALVSCDLLSMPGDIAAEARLRISRDPGIAPSHVMISATHTHTGPVLLTGQIRYNLEGELLRIGRQYTNELPGRIQQAVAAASANLRPVRLLRARAQQASLTFNRRFWMKDGTVGWNPGKGNPNIVRVAGPIDPEVAVLAVESMKGDPLGAIVNYALHLDTVGGMRYSADYPFTLARNLQEARGEGFFTMFTLGAAGNLNHIDVSSGRPQKGQEEAARIGTVLAATVLESLRDAAPIATGELRASTRTVSLPLAAFTAEELEWARRTAATFGGPSPAPFLDLVKASRVLATAERQGRPIEAEVQVISIGRDVAWVALPGEIFTELGQAIKLASPFAWTSVVTLANDNPGYIPDRKAHAQGAYEAISARVAPGSGELLVEAATRALVEHMLRAVAEHIPPAK